MRRRERSAAGPPTGKLQGYASPFPCVAAEHSGFGPTFRAADSGSESQAASEGLGGDIMMQVTHSDILVALTGRLPPRRVGHSGAARFQYSTAWLYPGGSPRCWIYCVVTLMVLDFGRVLGSSVPDLAWPASGLLPARLQPRC
jgi:hypothetical protein